MRKPLKAAAVIVAALVAATASPSAASAAPKAKPAPTAGCTAQLADGVGDATLYALPVFAGRTIMGYLVPPAKGGKLTVTAVADELNGYDYGQMGEGRNAFRLATEGLSFVNVWNSMQVQPLGTREAWISSRHLTPTGKFTNCAATLPYTPFVPSI